MYVKAVECRECGDQFVYSGSPRWFHICPKCNAKRVRRACIGRRPIADHVFQDGSCIFCKGAQ